jgi:hypothetical protein
MQGRKQYARPQAMLWSDSPWEKDQATGIYFPPGDELTNFIVLTDDNRAPMSFAQNRIENRVRTINGRMRSYWTADKLSLSVSWQRVPSRSFSTYVTFDPATGKPILPAGTTAYTSDAGAAGDLILQWYQNYPGPFWVYLSYDKYINFPNADGNIDENSFTHLAQYNQELEMYFSSFNYTVEKRGATNYDFWNIDLALEEV